MLRAQNLSADVGLKTMKLIRMIFCLLVVVSGSCSKSPVPSRSKLVVKADLARERGSSSDQIPIRLVLEADGPDPLIVPPYCSLFLSEPSDDADIYTGLLTGVTHAVRISPSAPVVLELLTTEVTWLNTAADLRPPWTEQHTSGVYRIRVLVGGYSELTEDYQWVKPTGITSAFVERYIK